MAYFNGSRLRNNLKIFANDATNNVVGEVDFEPGDTTDVRNYLIVEGPKANDDAYTEMNADGWGTVEVGNVLSGYTAISPITPRAGAAAIKCTSSDEACELQTDFSEVLAVVA